MSSVCISNCVNDARDPRVPVRATYTNLYKWPESDAEFVRSVSLNGRKGSSHLSDHGHPRVVDSISCRQMYLRSYTFSREEEKTQKCFGRVKEKVDHGAKKKRNQGRRRNKCLVLSKMKEISCNTLFLMFHNFFSCGTSVDVVNQKQQH